MMKLQILCIICQNSMIETIMGKKLIIYNLQCNAIHNMIKMMIGVRFHKCEEFLAVINVQIGISFNKDGD